MKRTSKLYCEKHSSNFRDWCVKAIHTLLYKHVRVCKLCLWWIPHNLISIQKEDRVRCCRSTQNRFDRGSSHLVYKIITGNETWVYCYDSEKSNSRLFWSLRMSWLRQKLFVKKLKQRDGRHFLYNYWAGIDVLLN